MWLLPDAFLASGASPGAYASAWADAVPAAATIHASASLGNGSSTMTLHLRAPPLAGGSYVPAIRPTSTANVLLAIGRVEVSFEVSALSQASASAGGGAQLTLSGAGLAGVATDAAGFGGARAVVFVPVPATAAHKLGVLRCDVLSSANDALVCKLRRYCESGLTRVGSRCRHLDTPAAVVIVLACSAQGGVSWFSIPFCCWWCV